MGNEKKEKFGTLGKMETEKWENGKSWKKWKMESGKLERKKSFEVTASKSCMFSCLHACCSHNWLFNHLYVSLSIRSFILSVRWPSKKIATKMPSRLVPMIATNISVPVPPLSHCPFARIYMWTSFWFPIKFSFKLCLLWFNEKQLAANAFNCLIVGLN